jgi:hypothetical protein
LSAVPGETDEAPVIAAIVGTVLVAAAAGAAWIWRQARRHRPPPDRS